MKNVPISVQILVAVLVTVVSVLGISSLVELNTLKNRETQTLREKGALAADRIANSLAYPLWNLSREETEQVVHDELGSADVFRIQVFDEKGALYVGKQKAADGAVSDLGGTNAGSAGLAATSQYSFSREVNFQNTHIGRVTLDVTDAHIQTDFEKLRRGIALRLLLLVLLLSVVLFVALRVLVVKPISSLKSWVETIPSSGILPPPRLERSAELSSLAEAFGTMSVKLQKKKEQLESEHARLRELNKQMQAEMEERKRAEGNFARVFDLSPFRMGIIRIKDGAILMVNDRFVRELGMTREEVLGHSIFEFDQQVSQEWKVRISQLLKEGKPVQDFENRVTTKAGDERVNLTSAEVVEFDGEPCFLWATNDITERTRAEDALRRNEELFRAIIQDQSEMIVRWKPDGTRTFVNRAYGRVFGKDPEEFIGTSFFPLIKEEYREGIRKKVQSLTPESPLTTETHERITSNGELRWQEWTDRGIFDEQGQLVELQSTGRDITERKLAEDALKASQEQLRALLARFRSAREEEGTRIAREIHDLLGGALTGLKWDLEGIEKILSASENGAGVNSVSEKIPAMTSLIDATITTIRRISSELRPVILDDLGLIAAIEWQAQQFQSRTSISCVCEKVDTVRTTPERATAVFRIFQEILTNVIRHAQATHVRVKMREDSGSLILEVKDNGRGITEEQKAGARSLGLLGMRERALLVGGEVTISGAVDAGTTVVVRVPIES